MGRLRNLMGESNHHGEEISGQVDHFTIASSRGDTGGDGVTVERERKNQMEHGTK